MKHLNIHLNSFGTKLRVKDGLFEIQYFKGKQYLKTEQFSPFSVQRIHLNRGTALSVDAIQLAIDRDVEILFQNRRGQPIGRVLTPTPNSTSLIPKAQVHASLDGSGLEAAKAWLQQKIYAQIVFIKNSKLAKKSKHTKASKDFLTFATKQVAKLEALKIKDTPKNQATIRGVEGSVNRMYFSIISAMLPSTYSFTARSRRPAKDPFNAFLNYGYGILYQRVERTILQVGLSPYIGFLHRDGFQFKSLVFDFIEPYRVLVDKTIFQLFVTNKIKSKHYQLDEETGGVVIELEGKKLLADTFSEMYQQRRQAYKKKQHTLEQIMLLEAQQFATSLKTKYYK